MVFLDYTPLEAYVSASPDRSSESPIHTPRIPIPSVTSVPLREIVREPNVPQENYRNFDFGYNC